MNTVGFRFMGLLAAVGCSGIEPAQANGQWTLAGDREPSEAQLWQSPATLSYLRQDGNTSASIDADLRYAYRAGATAQPHGWASTTWSGGGYIHRQTDDDAPRNDRGVSLGFDRSYRFGAVDPTETDAAASVDGIKFLNVSLTGKAGRTRVYADGDAAGAVDDDKDSTRLMASADYVVIPKTRDVPGAADIQVRAGVGAYHDRLSGDGARSGSLGGVSGLFRVDVAIWGLDPNYLRVSEGLGFAPTVYVAAQVQKDLVDSGDRQRGRHTLYKAGIRFNFAKLGAGHLVPSLTLERSTGEDILTGREKTGKTSLALGIAF